MKWSAQLKKNSKKQLISHYKNIFVKVFISVVILNLIIFIFQNFLNKLSIYYLVIPNALIFFFLLNSEQNRLNQIKRQSLEMQNTLRVILHDLANPLTLIISYAQLLKRSIKPEEKPFKHIMQIENSAQEICLILNTLKDLEAYSSGKKQLKYERINLKNMLNQIGNNFAKNLKDKSIGLQIFCDEQLTINSHKAILENQIFNNLLSNAIKFSQENSTIEIVANPLEENKVKLSIIDHGVGIPQEDQKKLFDPLLATSRLGTMGETGTGFGLPIALKFCKLMKIRLSVNSSTKEENPHNHGTTFEMVFQS